MRLELIEGKLSRSVPRGLGGSNPTWLLGAGRKGRKDLARSLPSFKVLGVLFLGEAFPAFWPSKKACGIHKFRHLGVRQQYLMTQGSPPRMKIALLFSYAVESPGSWVTVGQPQRVGNGV